MPKKAVVKALSGGVGWGKALIFNTFIPVFSLK